MNIDSRIEQELRVRRIEAGKLEKKIATMPQGQLRCQKNRGKYFKCFVAGGEDSDGVHQVYLPRKNRKQAVKLAEKAYYEAKLKACHHEIMGLEAYQKYHTMLPEEAGNALMQQIGFRDLLAGSFNEKHQYRLIPGTDQTFEEWRNEAYQHNPYAPETLKIETGLGFRVRSKSELLIANELNAKNIGFRYEACLIINGQEKYPDFTILHPITGRKYVWEHFGMMDDPAYLRRATAKITDYLSSGYIPNINFIMTFETASEPLGADLVRAIIHHYFE